MRQENFSYAQADKNFYEAMRINKGKSTEWSATKEGNALIDTSRTPLNYELVPHHEALNPSDYCKHNRGHGIAEYHKKITGRAARMNGQEEQRSKAVGCIITMPRNYLRIDYGLTDAEYNAIARSVENGKREKKPSLEYQSAIKKIREHEFSLEERNKIDEFLMSAFVAWKRVAGIRDEDVLYAVVHYDESYPHLHIMALPSIVEVDPADSNKSKIRFSTSKYNNRTTGYYDNLHTRVILEMKTMGIDASGLLNGVTKGKGFSPADLDHGQREESVRKSIENQILSQRNQQLVDRAEAIKMEIIKTEGQRAVAEQEIEALQNKKMANQSLSKKEVQAHKKELHRIQKKEGNPQITQYEYERLIQAAKTEKELQEELHKLSEREKNFKKEVKKAAEAMFPEELKQVRKEKEYCDEWLPKAQAVEQQQLVNHTTTMELAEWEEQLARRERTLNSEVEERAQQRAQELFQQRKMTLLGVIWGLVVTLINTVISIIAAFLPESMLTKVIDLTNDFRFDLEKAFDEPEIEHKEQGE